jgi:hypothetical protein
MIVALGTSTPTSITVVAIRQSISPARNRPMTCSRVSRFSRPCSAATRAPRSGPSSSFRISVRRLVGPSSAFSSIAGTTT